MNVKHLLGSAKDSSLFDSGAVVENISRAEKFICQETDSDRQTSEQISLVVNELDVEQVQSLVFPEQRYALGLRITMLRVLLKTSAASSLMSLSGFGINRVLEFLGFANYARFAQGKTFSEIKSALVSVLRSWEAACGTENWFPSSLASNLEDLAQVVKLNSLEKTLLGFGVLLHAEPLLEQCTDLMGSEQSGISVHIPLGHILALKAGDVECALSQEGNLHRSGLMSVDLNGRYSMRQLLDLLTPTFHARMTIRQSDIRNIVAGFVKPAGGTTLDASHYCHVSDAYQLTKNFLQRAIETAKQGTNILIYGAPGTGKSQLARVIARDLGVQLMEISPTNLAGDAITPMRRIRSYGIAQSFYSSSDFVLLFDEVEEVLALKGIDHGIEEAKIPQKSFLTALLEKNQTPAIWIANDISEFDPAYIRRFDICLEIPVPPLSVRLGMLKAAFSGEHKVSDELLRAVAINEAITPALIQQAWLVTSMASSELPQLEREKVLVNLLNEKLRAQGARVLQYSPGKSTFKLEFEPRHIRCDVDLVKMTQAIRVSQAGRVCLFGPPGTGKTAFGKWLAQQLDKPHLVLSASSLMSKYVGDTERNIAQAFAAAKRDGAVLQFDEVDTFLSDRNQAKHQYETSQVNEMLVQMENFDGVFIASTNLVDRLDEASLRRFDMVIKFDFITSAVAIELFQRVCTALGLSGHHPEAISRISHMGGLTPGDFEQVLRRARLTGVRDQETLVEALNQAVRMKRTTQHSGIGFLRAA